MALAADRVRLAHKHRAADKHKAVDKLRQLGRLREAHRLRQLGRLRLSQTTRADNKLPRPNPEIPLTGATMVPTTFLSDRLVNL